MSWATRNEAQNRAEAIVSLTDGIANNEEPSDLNAYASKWGIPLAMQNTKTAPQLNDTVVVDDDDDDEDDDYYESSDSDYYESSDCW